VREVLGFQDAELARRERELETPGLAEDRELDARPAAVELGEREGPERHSASRGDRARVEEDEILTAVGRQRAVAAVVDAQVEGGSRSRRTAR
jgi:hypothetical protein